MLCVLFVEIRWTKQDRNPQSASGRREWLKPVAVTVNHSSCIYPDNSCLLKKIFYVQNNDQIRMLPCRSEKQTAVESPDGFEIITPGSVSIPDIEILREENCHRIRWFDSGAGNVRRRGGNEDFLKRGARFSGEPNRLNETAFRLRIGQKGMVSWNNRFSSYHGQWYKEYRAYFVSTDQPDSCMFLENYDFRYEQMADLF